MADRSLRGRYPGAALITGASSGIGEAFARRLGREKFDLVLVARREDRLAAVKEELESRHGIRVETIVCDLADRDAVSSLPQQVAARGLEIGLLVNNAGFVSFGRFWTLDVASQARMVDVHCRAPLVLTGAFLPRMIQLGRGGLIFVSSISAYQPTPLFATYGATKAFILMFGEALWAELSEVPVDVIVCSPGYTHTELQQTGAIDARPLSGWHSADQVVDACLKKLGRTPSFIPGWRNFVMASAARLSPRRLAARLSYRTIRRSHGSAAAPDDSA